ncbi:STAS domain-containing protein [Candidatus Sumerlaeota bacterium]|nr:STAS domain-containing protein [Candidatus Sumerlaeota bacterium]
MDLVVEGNQQKLTVKVIGEINAETTDDLREVVSNLMPRHPQIIVVDLSETSFIDSMGIGALMGLRAQLKKNGCDFSAANPQPRIREVLVLTRVASLLGLDEA